MKPSILVRVHINSWSALKEDREATEDARRKYTSATAVTYKRLFGRGSLYDKVIGQQNNCRNMLYQLSSPWDDNSWRIVAGEGFPKMLDKMRVEIDTHNTLVSEFLAKYPDLVREDALRQGSLYKATDYPALEDMQDKFKVSLYYRPTPQVGDFRVELDDDTMEELRTKFEQDTKDKLQAAQSDATDKVKAALTRLKDKLESYGPGKRLHETTLTNLIEICDALPGLNISGDESLDNLASDIKDSLKGEDIDLLRDDESRRRKVAEDANRFLAILGDK